MKALSTLLVLATAFCICSACSANGPGQLFVPPQAPGCGVGAAPGYSPCVPVAAPLPAVSYQPVVRTFQQTQYVPQTVQVPVTRTFQQVEYQPVPTFQAPAKVFRAPAPVYQPAFQAPGKVCQTLPNAGIPTYVGASPQYFAPTKGRFFQRSTSRTVIRQR